jgi:hypothetical protein
VATYRVRVTAELSAWTAVDLARLRARTSASVTMLGPSAMRIEVSGIGTDPECAAHRALHGIETALLPVRFLRPPVWVARRRGPLGLGRRTTGRWHAGGDDDGLAGVREPRRPAPTAGSAAAAIDPYAA